MVITQNSGIIFVMLTDGEKIPRNLNSIKAVIMRRGESTNREVMVVKLLGELASEELLADQSKVCTYTEEHPLHQHEDDTWWFYEVNRKFENGPYPTREQAYEQLQEYCEMMVKLSEAQNEPSENEIQEEDPEIEGPEAYQPDEPIL